MQVTPLQIPDVKILVPKKHGDERGFFSETWSRRAFDNADLDLDFVQENHSLSVEPGVVRGLHYQIPPWAQDKLVRVVAGSIRDIAVDIRRGSPTFGRHVSAVISAEDWNQILVPAGFAHGFVTLEPRTEVVYKVTAPYAPDLERGIRWNDPALAIDWGIHSDAAILNDRDRAFPLLADATDLF